MASQAETEKPQKWQKSTGKTVQNSIYGVELFLVSLFTSSTATVKKNLFWLFVIIHHKRKNSFNSGFFTIRGSTDATVTSIILPSPSTTGVSYFLQSHHCLNHHNCICMIMMMGGQWRDSGCRTESDLEQLHLESSNCNVEFLKASNCFNRESILWPHECHCTRIRCSSHWELKSGTRTGTETGTTGTGTTGTGTETTGTGRCCASAMALNALHFSSQESTVPCAGSSCRQGAAASCLDFWAVFINCNSKLYFSQVYFSTVFCNRTGELL